MSIYDFLPIRLLVEGAYWVVTHLGELLEPLAGTQSAALAIVVLTLGVRALLIPVGRSQAKAALTRQRIAPQLAELQRRYRKQPETLQRKTMEIYSAERASPFAGCLPVLAQMPVLMAVYGLFVLPEIGGHPNELLSHELLGVPLDTSLVAQVTGSTLTPLGAAVGLGLMACIAVVTWVSRRLLPPPQPAQPAAPAQPGMPDLSGLTRALGFVPFITVVIAAIAPLAAALYLATTTAWTLCERLVLGKIYGTLGNGALGKDADTSTGSGTGGAPAGRAG